MPSQMGLLDLARHLRQEYLFISSERQNLQNLNEKVLKTTERLYHLSWIARQQKVNLDHLTTSHRDENPALFCQQANLLGTSNFIDSYKQLGINDGMYAELLQQLRENPQLIATCLNIGEQISIDSMHNVVGIIMSSLYGNCLLPEDERFALTLLKELMPLQLAISDNPRRLLRHGSCAFSHVYKAFNEGLFSAKIFLTAALHEPIMHVLMNDDLFLDIDPSKAAVRFHPQERLRHFGKEGTQEYLANLQRHRNWTINKLFSLTMHFIEGIRSHLCCFPQSLSWLTRQMYNLVIKAKRVEVREVGAMCSDFVFAFFICPAIVNPAPYGITDIHISDIARFNLMQVAQILQVLAMSKWEEINPKLMDLYGKFEKDCMSSILDLILEGSTSDIDLGFINQFQEMNKSAILITESDLMTLITFLKSVENEAQDVPLKKMLYSLITHIPNPSPAPNGDVTSPVLINANQSLSSKKGFLGKVSKRSSKLSGHTFTMGENHSEEFCNLEEAENAALSKYKVEDVLVVPIPGVEFECPGMLSEDKVLVIESQKKRQSRKCDSLNIDDCDGSELTEKRTRFILSQDQESIGTSDNLEAISEAASNHSVASSVDLENENDNLSDMVSANVSGRGTPNVSGRDTPSSQLEGEDQHSIDLVGRTRKNQEDIEDKFGKFEIQPLVEGDETKSIVSDTWSTDVLASDSETIEQLDLTLQLTTESQHLSVLDMSETASQSDAWSTDVLASDTERLLDVDTDDTASVARSDDTGRSEADGEVPQCFDITPMDGKDFMDLEHVSDSSLGGSLKMDSYGSDYRMFVSQRYSSSYLSDHSKSSLTGLQEDGEDDQDVFLEKNLSKGIENFDGSDAFKVPDVLCPDDDNIIQLSMDSQDNEEMNSMQSLGRVSLAIRELSNEDQDSGSLLLDSLQETVAMQKERSSHRSSIADILSLDLTRTLNLHNEMCSPEDPNLSKSSSSGVLMDIENPGDQVSPGCQESKLSGMERSNKRKLPDGFSGDDSNPRMSATSISSSASSTASSESNMKIPPDIVEVSVAGDGSQKSNLSHLPTGAIPKSISFDKTVYGNDNQDEKFGNDKHRKGIFKLSGLRFPFKVRNRKSHIVSYRDSNTKDDSKSARQSQGTFAEMRAQQLEAGDEILAKYRKKSPSLTTGSQKSDSTEASSSMSDNILLDSGLQVFDAAPVEGYLAFYNAKRKLRLVLGSANLQTLPWQNCMHTFSDQRLQDNELVAFLKVLLAEAINLQQRPLLSHLREALRCVQMFDDLSCQKLFRSLREDYKKRAPYIAYLVRCRQGLLCTLSHLDTLLERIERDKQVCHHNLVMICVRLFLEKHERPRQLFIRNFVDLTVSDEKAMLVQNFLTYLFKQMKDDVIWQTANEPQVEHAQVVIERIVMGQIYMSALHPNGDGDVLRDKVLHEHVQKLSQVISPSHKSLRISKQFHSECPWPSAQAELELINAYKTPRDKVYCVVRCCNTIMNLLSISSDKGVPAADDFLPVLVFVLIKANPSNMLSTVQYVSTFYEKQLEGEEAYWWTQFCSSIEFIKTMDY